MYGVFKKSTISLLLLAIKFSIFFTIINYFDSLQILKSNNAYYKQKSRSFFLVFNF